MDAQTAARTADDARSSESERNPLRRLLETYGRPHRGTAALGLTTQALGRVPEQLPGLVLGVAIDAVFLGSRAYDLPLVPAGWVPDEPLAQVWFTAGVFALAYVTDASLDYVSGMALGRFGHRFVHDLRTDAYDRAQRLGVAYFDDRQTGEVMAVLNNDVNNVQQFVDMGGLGIAVRFGSLVVVVFAVLFWLNWQLALVVAVAPVVIAVAVRLITRPLGERYDAVREHVGRLTTRLETNVGGVETIKATGAERREVERVAEASGRFRDRTLDAVRLRVLIEPVSFGIQHVWFAGLFLLGGYWVLFGPPAPFTLPLTGGSLVTFLIYVERMREPVRRLAELSDTYEDAVASSRRVVALFDEPARIPDPVSPVSLERPSGAVAFEEVTFSYPGATVPAVDGISFAVEPGEFVGVVGPSGAGKSTIARLLLRFHDADEGTVRLDGHDVRELRRRDLRDAVGHVSQEPFLFHGTVRENVAYGQPEADPSAVEHAVRLAGAHEFVRELPDGYDTQVGERGVKLSGGQRQRLAIARALFADPVVLLLDEATSHVDNETEALIQRHLDAVTADRTTIAIAHRLSTVRDADTILVVEDGRIVETGTHEALLEAEGRYADLWRVQVGAVGLGAGPAASGGGRPDDGPSPDQGVSE